MPPKTKRVQSKSKPYEGLSVMKGSRLIKKLQEIDVALQKARTVSDFPGFSNLLNEIRSDKLLKNEKKEVKRVLGCCCMEILRLSEGIELSESESRDFIGLILTSLHCLENPSSNVDSDRMIRIYRDLCESVVLRILVTTDVCNEMSVDLMNLIFSISSSHPKETLGDTHIRLLLSLLDLYKHIPNELLDILLQKLVEKDESVLVKEVLVSRKSRLSGSVQQFCMNLLCDSSVDGSCYESGDHLYSILVELSTVSGDYVTLLLPLVTQQFKVENDKTRYEVVNCLSQIFCNPQIDYMKQNEGCFNEFCTRFQDRSPDIRVLMCEMAKDLIQCQPSCLNQVIPLVKERIKDSQWEVRRSAVDSLCNLLNTHFDSIPTELVYTLSERMMDKRSEVRKFAITGLMNILSIHCSEWWNRQEYVSKELSKKLGVIVVMFVRCFSCCNDETKNRCSRLFNEILISNCDDQGSIGTSYLWFFKELGKTYTVLEFQENEDGMVEKSILSFRGMIRDSVRLRGLLKSLVKEARLKTPLENEKVSEQLLNLSYSLFLNQTSHSGAIPTYNTSNNCLYCLYRLMVESEEREQILSWVSRLCEDCVSLDEVGELKKNLLILMKGESEGPRLQAQLKSVMYRFYCSVCSREVVSVYLDMIANGNPLSQDCVNLLEVLSEECPGAFMFWSLQVSLFGLFQRYLYKIVNESLFGRQERALWRVFIRVLGNQSKEYPKHGDVLLNEAGEWNEGYNEELLPLIDLIMDNMSSFPAENIDSLVLLVSQFCRFIQSGNEATDKLIRIRYNEWLNEYLPSLSTSKEDHSLFIDLHCVCTLLKVDSSNCSHLGIRCLLDSILNNEVSLNQETHLMSLAFLSAYAVAVNHDGDSSNRILEYLLHETEKEDEVSVKSLSCLLELGCMKVYSNFFTAERFYALGQRIERIKDTRLVCELVRCISSLIRGKQLPVKYICYIVECWLQNKTDVQELVKEELKLIIHNQRKYLLFYQSSHLMASESTPPLYQLSPEYCLVYLLPLLSRLSEYKDLNKTPSKLQIRCVDVFLTCLLSESTDSVGLLNAILVSMHRNEDRLMPENAVLSRLIVLSNQLVQKRIQGLKRVDVSYSEAIRLPAQYYMSSKKGGMQEKTTKRGSGMQEKTIHRESEVENQSSKKGGMQEKTTKRGSGMQEKTIHRESEVENQSSKKGGMQEKTSKRMSNTEKHSSKRESEVGIKNAKRLSQLPDETHPKRQKL